MVDLPGTELHTTAQGIEKAGGKAFAFEADVTKEHEIKQFIQATEEQYGGLDILFNNAGIFGVAGPLQDQPNEAFDKVLQVNVKGVWLGMKHAYKAMKQRGGGAIVNNASIAGLSAIPHLVAYTSSKYAVVGMSKTAAVEFAPANIRVNAVCPGLIHTRMGQQLMDYMGDDGTRTFFNNSVPMDRIGQVEEVANLVTFLSSDEASFITGGVYTVDGGYMAP